MTWRKSNNEHSAESGCRLSGGRNSAAKAGAGAHGKLATLACSGKRARPTGEDPGYDDDFQRIREEVNKLSGIDTGLICTLAEKLLTTTAKDIRIATYYCWARCTRTVKQALPKGLNCWRDYCSATERSFIRSGSEAVSLRWSGLQVARLLDSLSLWPEVVRDDAQRTAGALLLISDVWRQSRKHHGQS
jgi:predicted component of type VI protein secretion system